MKPNCPLVMKPTNCQNKLSTSFCFFFFYSKVALPPRSFKAKMLWLTVKQPRTARRTKRSHSYIPALQKLWEIITVYCFEASHFGVIVKQQQVANRGGQTWIGSWVRIWWDSPWHFYSQCWKVLCFEGGGQQPWCLPPLCRGGNRD